MMGKTMIASKGAVFIKIRSQQLSAKKFRAKKNKLKESLPNQIICSG